MDPTVQAVDLRAVVGAVSVAAVGVELVQSQQGSFRDGLRRLHGVQPADARAVGDGRILADALPAQEPGHVAAYAPHGARVEVLRLAQAGHHHALGRNPVQSMYQREFAQLALYLTVGDQLRDRPAQRAVDRAGSPAGLRHALEKIHHQRRRREVGRVSGGYLDRRCHAASPEIDSLTVAGPIMPTARLRDNQTPPGASQCLQHDGFHILRSGHPAGGGARTGWSATAMRAYTSHVRVALRGLSDALGPVRQSTPHQFRRRGEPDYQRFHADLVGRGVQRLSHLLIEVGGVEHHRIPVAQVAPGQHVCIAENTRRCSLRL